VHVHTGGHDHLHALEARRADSRRRMWVALGINVAMLLVEAVGGLLTGSLAVLADAGHLLSDVGSIGLALLAAGLASRPAGARRTFGYQRSEVLAALANGLLLVAVSVAVAVAALGRLGDPPAIDGGGVSSPSAWPAWPATWPRRSSSPAAAARTSTSRGSCATAPPTRSAPSVSSSPAPWCSQEDRRWSTRSRAW
jgi:hypothetical protein